MRGEFFIIGAQVVWAISALLSKKLSAQIHPALVTFLFAAIGTLSLLPFFIYFSKDIALLSRQQWIWIVAGGVLWIALGEVLYIYGVSKISLLHAGLLALTYPLFITILGVIFLGEVITLKFLIASALFVAGYLVLVL